MSKPKSSRVVCPACGRMKMVFETEKKAQNFMKFNNQNFDNTEIVPVRAYYCAACGGWHVTKRKTWNKYKEDPAEKLVKAYKNATEKKPKRSKEVRNKEEEKDKTLLYDAAYKLVCDLRYKYAHNRSLLDLEELRKAKQAVEELEKHPDKTRYCKKTSQLENALETLWYNMTSLYLSEAGRALLKDNSQEVLLGIKTELLDWVGLVPVETIIRSTIYSDLDKEVQNLVKRIDDKINN